MYRYRLSPFPQQLNPLTSRRMVRLHVSLSEMRVERLDFLADNSRKDNTVKIKHLIMTALMLAMLIYTHAVAQADPLTFVNAPPVAFTGQGSTVLFSITLTNSGPGSLTIRGLAAGGFFLITNPGVPQPGFGVDIDPFQLNFLLNDPVFLEGETRSALALVLTVGPNVPFGTYTAPFTIFYEGATGTELLSVSQDFTVHVVPEPTTMLLFGTGLMALAAKVGQRRRCLTERKTLR